MPILSVKALPQENPEKIQPALGVEFTEGPWADTYGKVAVFKDLYGNRIDLIQPS